MQIIPKILVIVLSLFFAGSVMAEDAKKSSEWLFVHTAPTADDI